MFLPAASSQDTVTYHDTRSRNHSILAAASCARCFNPQGSRSAHPEVGKIQCAQVLQLVGTKFLVLQSAGHRFFAAMCAIFSTGALKKKARTNVKNPVVQRAQTPISPASLHTRLSIVAPSIDFQGPAFHYWSLRVENVIFHKFWTTNR